MASGGQWLCCTVPLGWACGSSFGGVTFVRRLAGTVTGILIAFVGGGIGCGAIKMAIGLRPLEEDERLGTDLAIHRITAQPDYNRGEV